MRARGKCFLSSNEDLKVKDMAENFEKMEEATEDDFTKDYLVKIKRARVGDKERKRLSKETVEFCTNEGIIRTEDKKVEKEIFEELAAGKIVTIEREEQTNTEDKCWLKVFKSNYTKEA